MKGFIHVGKVKERLDRTSPPRRSELENLMPLGYDSKFFNTYNCRTA